MIAFVVLHYISDELTVECINSILSLEEQEGGCEVGVVVVDNASGNGSTERVEAEYRGEDLVRIVRNSENLGFSRANNIGYRVAMEEFSPRHVVILNNDTVIRQGDFLERIDSVYARNGRPHVIGPDIFVERRGYHQNPILPEMRTRAEVECSLAILEAQAAGARSKKERLRDVLERTNAGVRLLDERRFRKRRKFDGWRRPSESCVLHGAALIFTEAFIGEGELPFTPVTFLYQEEQILALRCVREGWGMLYTPELQVIHFDDGSTDILTEIREEKRRFLRGHEIDSHKILLRYWDECDGDAEE